MIRFYDFQTYSQGFCGNGIFQKLKGIYEIEDISSCIITLSASGSDDAKHPINNVLSPTDGTYWISENEVNSYLEVGFDHNKVRLSSIQIKTMHRDLFNTYIFYGINNRKEPIEIGKGNTKLEDRKDLHSPVEYDFPITNSNAWNKIRIQGDGMRVVNNYHLVFHLLEFQGEFIANNPYQTCVKVSKMKFVGFLYSSFLMKF